MGARAQDDPRRSQAGHGLAWLAVLLLGTTTGAGQSPPAAQATAEPAEEAPATPAAERTHPLDGRLRAVQERRTALERELGRLRGQERSLLGEVERLELEQRLSTEELRETQLLLQRTQAQLDTTLVRLRSLDQAVRTARPVLRGRARALYKLGELSYVRLLLSVDRPADIFRGYRFVTALARRDRERFAAFRRALEELSSTRVELERRTAETLRLQGQVVQRRREVAADRQRKTELLTRLVERKETHAAYVAELEQAERRLAELVAGWNAGQPTDSGPSVPLAAFRGALPWPVEGTVRVPFGRRKHPRFDTYTLQNGVEIAAPAEAPVRAVHEGSVAFAGRFSGYGLVVILDHGGKHHSLYAHLAHTLVSVGQRVEAGQELGGVGLPGLAGPGLYFEMRFQGKAEDPTEWLRSAEGRATRAERRPRTRPQR